MAKSFFLKYVNVCDPHYMHTRSKGSLNVLIKIFKKKKESLELAKTRNLALSWWTWMSYS